MLAKMEVGLDAAWQDAKLLLSFAVGIIFMRCLEVLAVGRDFWYSLYMYSVGLFLLDDRP